MGKICTYHCHEDRRLSISVSGLDWLPVVVQFPVCRSFGRSRVFCVNIGVNTVR
jgi:hypothetical protein